MSIHKTRIFGAIHEKPGKVGGARWGGGPTLLAHPAGFPIRITLGTSKNNFYKNKELSYANKFFFEMKGIFSPILWYFYYIFVYIFTLLACPEGFSIRKALDE